MLLPYQLELELSATLAGDEQAMNLQVCKGQNICKRS